MRNFKSILKKLRKLWRKKKSWAIVMITAILLGSIGATFAPLQPEVKEAISQDQTKVVLERQFVCGKSETETLYMNDIPFESLLQAYSDWEATFYDGKTAKFTKKIWDLAPECKLNGYFGVSDEGILTLFNGPPQNNEVIETFFRIDIEKLRSGLDPEPISQLYKGIKINDMSAYNSVLSLFSPFSTD